MKQYTLVSDGEKLLTEDVIDVINPATEEVFAQCVKANAADVDTAVKSARLAFKSWSALTLPERGVLLHAIAVDLENNMSELMGLVTQETGKPLGGLNGVGAGMEVGGSMGWTHYTADLTLPVQVIEDSDTAYIELHRKPLGVVGSITPWNWPMMIAVWHIMPALLAGNTVVLKPSPLTPIATLRLVEIANQHLPEGVLNVVVGETDVGEAIASHDDINKIIFTGSSPTGRHIMKSAAANLKRLTLELGGNDAGIVLDDVDVASVAPKIFGACFHNNGQTCAALKRLYVHESVYDELSESLAAMAKSVKVGNGLEDGIELGPVQNAAQLAKVESLAEDARAAGGRFLAGGNRMAGKGYFFEPTIVADLPMDSRLIVEEPFGPILPIIKYSDLDDVIELANDSESGLGGSIWSSDEQRAAKIAICLESGSVWVNDHGAIQPNAPFGGVKQSGFGVEFGQHGLEEYTSIQTLKIAK